MSAAQKGRSIDCVSVALRDVDVDLLALPWFERDRPSAFADLDRAAAGEIARALESGEFKGRPFEVFVTPIVDRNWKAHRLVLIGAGAEAAYSPGSARRLASAAGLIARQRLTARLGLVMRPGPAAASGDVDVAGLLQAIAEGLTLSEYSASTYQTGEASTASSPALTIVVPPLRDTSPESPARLHSAIARGRVLGEATNLARDLANEPANRLTPREFAARAAGVVTDAGADARIIEPGEIDELGLSLIQAVAKGSGEPSRLMVLRHAPPDAPVRPVLGLVGKGITFDTGGLSIKPAHGMERMKDEMAGGAAVVAAIAAMARLNAPMRVVGVVPAMENMPGSGAVKPGDVLRSAAGKTVEVIDTDAEGQLVLADALWYARQLGATHLVDVATLSPAVVTALGNEVSGLFGGPDWGVEQVRRVGERAGDRLWQLPLVEDYR
ncbi:MAG: M17 family metallopeptidase, partial [Vicinamibacterales bacterium]